MEITFEEAVEYLEDGEEITLECEGYSYEISPSENWVGGDGQDGYISSVLGNHIFYNADKIIKDSVNFLSKDGQEVIITI